MEKIILTCRVTDKHNVQTMQSDEKYHFRWLKCYRHVLTYIGRQLKRSNSTYFNIPSKKLSCLAHTVFKTHTNSKCNRSAHLKELTYLSTIEANNSNHMTEELRDAHPKGYSSYGSNISFSSLDFNAIIWPRINLLTFCRFNRTTT